MDHTEYVVGQEWRQTIRSRSGTMTWDQEWRVVEVDRRMSVTFLKVNPPVNIRGDSAHWISTGLFAVEMEKRGAFKIS